MKPQAVTREQLHEMLDLILDINGMEARTRKETGNKPTAFMRFSGHTFDVDIRIYKNGWSRVDKDDEAEIDETISLSDGITWHGRTIDDVMSLLKTIEKDR